MRLYNFQSLGVPGGPYVFLDEGVGDGHGEFVAAVQGVLADAREALVGEGDCELGDVDFEDLAFDGVVRAVVAEDQGLELSRF